MTHNGAQDAVYRAVQRGEKTVEAIMAATALDENTVRTSVRRLLDTQRIAREYAANGRHNTEYVPSHGKCLLAQVWR